MKRLNSVLSMIPQRPPRSFERWAKLSRFDVPDIDAFAKGEIPVGITTIHGEAVPIDLYASIKPGAPLLVFLDGNLPRATMAPLPYFSGFGVTPKDRPVSAISISDPSFALAPDLTLAWYAGSEKMALQILLVSILTKAVAVARPSKVVFMGGSGGGFASLFYSSFVQDSIALVWNPQTDIRAYNPAHVEAYARIAFPADFLRLGDPAAVLDRNIVADVSRCYPNARNYVIYLQNASDWHVSGHLAPFLRKQCLQLPAAPFSGMIDQRLYLHLAEWGKGHVPPPKEVLTTLLAAVLDLPRRGMDQGATAAALAYAFSSRNSAAIQQ